MLLVILFSLKTAKSKFGLRIGLIRIGLLSRLALLSSKMIKYLASKVIQTFYKGESMIERPALANIIYKIAEFLKTHLGQCMPNKVFLLDPEISVNCNQAYYELGHLHGTLHR
jgi:hypothetical protein